MTPDELRVKRAERRDVTMAPRSEAELHALPDDAYITPVEGAVLLRVSVESLMLNRSRRRPPVGFRLGRYVRFTMGEIRAVRTASSEFANAKPHEPEKAA
jgi:hypothetical protein